MGIKVPNMNTLGYNLKGEKTLVNQKSVIQDIGDFYKLKSKNIEVEMKYAKNHKKLQECMQEVLKQKVGNNFR